MWATLWSVLSTAAMPGLTIAASSLIWALLPAQRSYLDKAGDRLNVAVMVLATLMASAMLAVGFVATRFAESDARVCLFERLNDGELFSFATAISWTTLWGCLAGLAFAFAQSLQDPEPSRTRRWLTASVEFSTVVSLLFFPVFVAWMLSAADC